MAKKIEIKKTEAAPAPKREEKSTGVIGSFALGKDNYMFILGGIALLVLGYVLMIGGGADSPDRPGPYSAGPSCPLHWPDLAA